jgi:hypothetical protein
MVLSIIPHIIIITFLFLLSLLAYNGIEAFYWIWKIRCDYSNTKYEHKKIRCCKKKIILISPIIIILGLVVLFYKAPVSFEKVVGSEKYPDMLESIYVVRANRGIRENIKITDKNEINNILNILAEYTFVRSLKESRFGNVGKSLGDEFVNLTITLAGNYHVKTFVINSNGFVEDTSTGQAYEPKAKTKNEMRFYNRLTDALPCTK